MLIREIATAEVVCCSVQTTASEAAQLMRHKHVGDLVLIDDPNDERNPLGIVTDRDLAIEVLGRGLDPASTTVGSLNRSPVVIARDSEDSSTLIDRMRMHGVRRVPVVDDHGSVCGIVTLDDLLHVIVDDARSLLDVMAKGRKREQRMRR